MSTILEFQSDSLNLETAERQCHMQANNIILRRKIMNFFKELKLTKPIQESNTIFWISEEVLKYDGEKACRRAKS